MFCQMVETRAHHWKGWSIQRIMLLLQYSSALGLFWNMAEWCEGKSTAKGANVERPMKNVLVARMEVKAPGIRSRGCEA